MGRSKERAFEQKEKSPQTLPPIPMKSLTVWHGHSTRPSLPAGTARKASGSLLHGRRNRLILQEKEKTGSSRPLGNSLVVHIAIVCGFWQGASGVGAPCFLFYTLIEKKFRFILQITFIYLVIARYRLFAASIPQSSRFMDRALIHPKKFMKVI